jgi:hypothetical protein
VWFRRRSEEPTTDSELALKNAQKNLREVKQRGKEVTEIAEALREIRERNHFAEQLELIIITRRGQLR